MTRLLTSRLLKAASCLLFGAAILLVAEAAPAQQYSSGWGTTAPAQPATQFTEDFDAGPLKGWDYSCQHDLVSTQGGRALQASGAGHAIWTAPGDLSDFALQFRYGYQQGVGDVVFRITETANGMECYCLKLEPHGISLVRRLHTPNQQFPEKELAAAQGALQPQQWYDFTIQAIGGKIDVAIGDQQVLSYLDPAPLTSGKCGLGVIANSGSVLYDDASLFPLAPAGATASTSQGSMAVNWP